MPSLPHFAEAVAVFLPRYWFNQQSSGQLSLCYESRKWIGCI